VRQLLGYDPEAGAFARLHVSHPRYARFLGRNPARVNHDGYALIWLDGGPHLAHRVAFVIMTGQWPEAEIDHLDGDRSNNRWSNLRPASRLQNCANTKRRRNNKSGEKGVCWVSRRNKWEFSITAVGRRTRRYFDTKEEAVEAYRAAAATTFGEFARAA